MTGHCSTRSRLAAFALFTGLTVGRAHACPFPLTPFNPATIPSDAIVPARVVDRQGAKQDETYILASIGPSTGLPAPKRYRIRLYDYAAGTCGFTSPRLAKGDDVLLYLKLRDGALRPQAWAKFGGLPPDIATLRATNERARARAAERKSSP
jgi:hypothetical protein